MKLTGRDAAAFMAKPKTDFAAVLLHGADAMRVALKRQDLAERLFGADAETEMRLTRLTGAELRSDPAKLIDAVKAVGFFPGARGVLVEGVSDGLTALFSDCLDAFQPGDAQIIATSKELPTRSKLRKLFEANARAVSIGIYNEPPSRAEIEQMLRDVAMPELGREADSALQALAQALDPGDFRQTVEKLALFALDLDRPISSADVDAVAPRNGEAGIDDILDAVASAEVGRIGALLLRISQHGVAPVSLCLAAERHFRELYAASIHAGGPAKGIANQRPPVFGRRRDRMLSQIRAWGSTRLEHALVLLVETDLALRSSARAPQMALVERALIRLAMMPRQK
ncbi:MAG: DNA polymerase III subunit delta [Pseudomonadota bacterium]